jgi:hypothetical protein
VGLERIEELEIKERIKEAQLFYVLPRRWPNCSSYILCRINF